MNLAAGSHRYGLRWPHPFFTYQEAGIERLATEPSVLLADEMGLGKTIQAVAALRVLVSRGEIRQALIVCPAGLIVQWRQQLRTWAPDLALATATGPAGLRVEAWRRAGQVYLTSYEALLNDFRLAAPYGPGRRWWDVVLLDEAQRIRNPKTDLSIAVKSLCRRRSWALTGTPLENRLDDLVSVLDFVAPGRFDRRSMAIGLRRLLTAVQLRRRRREVLADLPPKLVSTVLLDLTAAQRNAYRRAENEGIVRLQARGTELRIGHVLELILRLKQICNFCPESGRSSKLTDLRDRLAGAIAADEKALVFSQFAEEPFGARRLARELGDFRPLLLTGDMDAAGRADAIDRFRREPARCVFVLSLRAGGLGLNLTEASRVYHFDRWWNPALETQAEDRAHRIGQTKPVHVLAYLCDDTIEQRIDEILTEKRALFADVIDGVGTRALGRLDLDSLLRAAAPRYQSDARIAGR